MIKLWMEQRIYPYYSDIMIDGGFIRLSNVIWACDSINNPCPYDVKIGVNFLDQGYEI